MEHTALLGSEHRPVTPAATRQSRFREVSLKTVVVEGILLLALVISSTSLLFR